MLAMQLDQITPADARQIPSMLAGVDDAVPRRRHNENPI
jgi:hypothetical protein